MIFETLFTKYRSAKRIYKREGLGELGWRTLLYMTPQTLAYKLRISRIRRQASKETDTDSCKILWINPTDIKYCTGTRRTSETMPHLDNNHKEEIFFINEDLGNIKDGDWDQNRLPFSETYLMKAISSRFKENTTWQETEFFQRHLDRIKQTGSSLRCRSQKELLERCQQTDELFEQIKQKGYKSQKQLGGNPLSEIEVNIGRNGRFLFNDDGRHRLSIARILNIEAVPVIVLVRHEQWQETRDKVRHNHDDIETELRKNHPDLKGIR